MKADVSRVTFRKDRHYSRVIQQQGRPILDADWNEQVAILSNSLRRLAGDLTGGATTRAGAPVNEAGFEISGLKGARDDFSVAAGRYYVDGLCCECEEPTSFAGQTLRNETKIENGGISLIYLDAWESVVTPVDDSGLVGARLVRRADLCPRARRLAGKGSPAVGTARAEDTGPRCASAGGFGVRNPSAHTFAGSAARPPRRADLRSWAASRRRAPGSRAFGVRENLLYRVEVHKGGAAGEATFKWSRDNGSTPAAPDQPGRLRSGGRADRPARGRPKSTREPGVEVCDAETRTLPRATTLVQIKGPGARRRSPDAGGGGRQPLRLQERRTRRRGAAGLEPDV